MCEYGLKVHTDDVLFTIGGKVKELQLYNMYPPPPPPFFFSRDHHFLF